MGLGWYMDCPVGYDVSPDSVCLTTSVQMPWLRTNWEIFMQILGVWMRLKSFGKLLLNRTHL